MLEHRDILRREFERIAHATDEAYQIMATAHAGGGPAKLLEKSYSDWASLLLRYHQAIEGVEARDTGGGPALPSMKSGQ